MARCSMIGRTLAHYRILDRLGSGGMGDVYLAQDTKLDRKVALKVLPAEAARDEKRRERFRGEAKAIASLDHPNIVHAYSVEEADGVHFITMQLVRGKTLRALVPRGGMALGQFFDIAIPLTGAVAAAHQAGITHRDLKPDNVMMTDEGRVKVLDFGLAKLVEPSDPGGVSEEPTVARLTEAGAVMGTVGYMSPEQVRGEPVGPGADVFALGVIAHEMLSGAAPFQRHTSPETQAAILKDDPPSLPSSTPPVLGRVVRRCLEKRPQERFHSAHDLSLALEALSVGNGAVGATSGPPPAARVSRRQVLAVAGGSALGLGAGLAAGSLMHGRRAPPSVASYHRLTFRRGIIRTARFGPDEQTILYGANWDGDVCRVYMVRPDSPESVRPDLPPATPLAVSTTGELALALGGHFRGVMTYGTLARVPVVGGAPRELVEDVKYADWSPDGADLAVVRRIGDREQLEFPIGRVIAEPSVPGGGFSFPRVSPRGDRVAFFEITRGLTGRVVVVDRRGGKRLASRPFLNVFGLAWKGEEIWFTAAPESPLARDAILAITEAERERIVARIPGNASLHDVSPTGRVLMAHTNDRVGISVLAPGDTAERGLSWLDASFLADISRDGGRILFTEGGVGGGPRCSAYLRSTTGSPAVRLGDGWAVALSPDGQWAVAIGIPGPQPHLDLLPTGAGQARRIERPGLTFPYGAARWLPDGKRLIVVAHEKDRRSRLYCLDADGDALDAVTPEALGPESWALSPDGTRVAVASGRGVDVYPVGGGAARQVPGPPFEGRLQAWIEDGLLFSRDPNGDDLGAVIQVDPVTGAQRPWRDVRPRDPGGILSVFSLRVTPDGRHYGYSWARATSNLYLVDGLS
jgi:hypothetical protein